jgi:hypothetical protein
MKRVLLFGLVVFAGAWLAGHAAAQTPGQWTHVTGKQFDGAIVPNFYIEGNAIPVEKRNGVMLKDPAGKRLIFGLLDTSGYSMDVQQKYLGLATVERKVSLGTAEVPVGAFGLGLQKAAAPSEAAAKLIVYDVAGQKVSEGMAQYDAKLAQPVPLQVVIQKDQAPRLYFGRYFVELK